MKRIACIDGIECLFSKEAAEHVLFLTTEKSVSAMFVREHFPQVQVCFLDADKPLDLFSNDEEVIRHTNILDAMRANGSDELFLSHRSSPFIESWARQNGIRLLQTAWSYQETFEEKLFFQKFLERNGLPTPMTRILRKPEDASGVSVFPVVLQHPALLPPIEHTVVSNAQELEAYLAKFQAYLPLLCRAFTEGMPLGVTLLIGRADTIVSALRLQCFAPEPPLQEFLGVHWIPRCDVPAAMIRTIEDVLLRLANAMRTAGFRGVANVDLIASDRSVVVLECNPRMSSSTPELAVQPELLHGLDFFAEFRRALAGKRLGANLTTVPDTVFRGSYIEFDYLIQRMPKGYKNVTIPPVGFYHWGNGTWKPTGRGAFSGKNEGLFYAALPATSPVSCLYNLAALFTNFPLFDIDGKGVPTMNSNGAELLQTIECSILGAPSPHPA
ncbi:MAG: ATP-grasp domain-containing protein [Candidatus Peribacteraceae bacterium]|nr:ATP-grasp domain-containing protein [Candidatus Peribacteraceae bacterium]